MPRGSGELLVPLIRYIAILGNGGKPLDEEAEGALPEMAMRSRTWETPDA